MKLLARKRFLSNTSIVLRRRSGKRPLYHLLDCRCRDTFIMLQPYCLYEYGFPILLIYRLPYAELFLDIYILSATICLWLG